MDGAHAHAAVAYRGGYEGADRNRQPEIGEAHLPHVGGEVRHTQGCGDGAEVGEELHPLRHLPQPLGLLGGQAGDHEILHLSGVPHGGDEGVAGVRQRTGAIQDSLQHRVELEALVDPQAGLAQPRETVPQRRHLLVTPVSWPHSALLTRSRGPRTRLQPDVNPHRIAYVIVW